MFNYVVLWMLFGIFSGSPCSPMEKTKVDCAQCTCVEGKMKCSPIPECFPASLRRQLNTIAGSLRSKVALRLEIDPCIPNMVYKYVSYSY